MNDLLNKKHLLWKKSQVHFFLNSWTSIWDPVAQRWTLQGQKTAYLKFYLTFWIDFYPGFVFDTSREVHKQNFKQLPHCLSYRQEKKAAKQNMICIKLFEEQNHMSK